MSTQRTVAAERQELRPLVKNEIDRLLEAAVATVTTPTLSTDEGHTGRERVRPRWISTAEFVRRMRRYLVYN